MSEKIEMPDALTYYTADEVAYFMSDAEPKVLICDPAASENLGPVAEAVNTCRRSGNCSKDSVTFSIPITAM